MNIKERFLGYVTTDSPSDPAGTNVPSNPIEFDMARKMVQEMADLGLSEVRLDEEHAYAYGVLPATPGYEDKPAIGFIAHMDTAPEFNGYGVKPQVIENYDGGDVLLAGSGHVLSPNDYPDLLTRKGHTLITTDGTSLLGADDKAGIAEIMDACRIIMESGEPHGKICVGFTPDEEIGHGPDFFDIEGFGAQFAYTVDGGPAHSICYETFNACAAEVKINGYSIHPGGAKNRMINAIMVGKEFDNLVPTHQRPEHTEGYEGYYHLNQITGGVETASLGYIIRDHDKAIFEKRQQVMREAAAFINNKYGEGTIELTIVQQYPNMAEMIRPHFHLIDNAFEAARKLGLTPSSEAARGGTDGAQLSFMGLPCPNLGTGGANAHGRFEYVSVEAMELCRDMVVEIIRLYANYEA